MKCYGIRAGCHVSIIHRPFHSVMNLHSIKHQKVIQYGAVQMQEET
jgi:hypothetical protein